MKTYSVVKRPFINDIKILASLILFLLMIARISAYGSDETSMTAFTTKKSQLKNTSTNQMALIDGKVTAGFSSAPIKMVMNEFNRLTGAQVTWQEQEIDRVVSINFTGLAFDEAAQHILQGENYIMLYTSGTDGENLLNIHVLAQAKDSEEPISTAYSIPYEDQQKLNRNSQIFSSPEIEFPYDSEHAGIANQGGYTELSDDYTVRRINEIDDILSDKNDMRSEEALTYILANDPEPTVRLFALNSLNELDTIPLDAMLDTALRDPDHTVRLHATQNLTMFAELNPIIKEMLSGYDLMTYENQYDN